MLSSRSNSQINPLKHQPPTMVKHAQTTCWQQPTNCLSVFDHFWGLAIKGVNLVKCNYKFKDGRWL